MSPSVMPPFRSTAAPVPTPAATRVPLLEGDDKATLRVRRRLTRWRAFGVLMTLVILAAAALVAAWKFAPDRVPPVLQPVELMRFVGVTIGGPPRKPAPPESQFDE